MTREERIMAMENRKVLNGRVFNPGILTKFGLSNLFDALVSKREDVKNAGLPKRFLKGEYKLFFLLFINKVLVPRTEKRTVAYVADLFLMEKLDELEEINLPAIMLECECVKGKSRSRSQKAVSRGLGTSDGNEQVLQKLRDENERLLKTNASPSEEVKALNMQLIKAHEDANEHLSMFMRTLNPFPLPS
ncbi:hypothetical protein KY284_030059 [Solanum tuberosum]|nr:hypothetical protein KY284_030059 [Solanum tuberosum]